MTCKKCGANLYVGPEGLQLAGGAAPTTSSSASQPQVASAPAVFGAEEAAPPPKPKKAGGGFGRKFSGLGQGFMESADPATILYGLGAFLTILFLFLPLIDLARSARIQGNMELGQVEENRAQRAYTEAAVKKTPTEQATKARDEAREAWEKERASLADDKDESNAHGHKANYWYLWGMMFGFLLLAFGSMGYLSPNQSTVRRVMGCITLAGQLVMIFIMFTFSSVVVQMVSQLTGMFR
jgi:hypothetical protein